jgi:hypothetical protein
MPIIRPEDLGYYKGIADYYKLVTRGLETKKINQFMQAYTD